MARETKVGLLAGLAFIVCFAIILTNNGQRDPLPASSRMADASRRDTPKRMSRPATDPTARDPLRTASPTTSTRANGNGPTVPLRPSTPSGQDGDRPATPEWRRPVPVTEYDPQREPIADADVAIGAVPILSPSTSLSSHPPQPDDTASRTTPSAGTLNERAQPGGTHGLADPPGTAQPQNPPSATRTTQHTAHDRPPAPTQTQRRAVLANYTVAPGDTLTRIAAKHYGQGSRRFIKAIVDANRSAIADPDKLRAGIDLVIPSMDATAVAPSGGAVATDVATADRPNARPMSRPDRGGQYRWYQIKKNDRYISIAREELGDASRWEEIYELNKEKFPDAGMIREGVRIKLPMEQSASAERRH